MALRDKKLPLDAKIVIVRALACYERPRDILAQLKEDWNITVDRKALRHYDPAYNPALDAELKALFQRTRESFWKEKDEEPLNCLNFRQRVRREILEAAGRNLPLQIEILSEAAKDEGGLFSRKPELGEAPNVSKTPDIYVENVRTASNEDLAYMIAYFPEYELDPDLARWMVAKGYRPPGSLHKPDALKK